MRTNDPNDNNPYGDQFDGGTATEAEQALIDAGLDEDSGNADAEAEAEATRLAQEAVEAARVAATATEAAAPAVVQLPDKPEPPKDFAAELTALEEKYDAGDMTVVEFNRASRALTLEEVAYTNAVNDWQRQADAAAASATANVQSEWDKTCVAFEAANADFLANPLRHQVMQNSIALVEKQAASAGETLTSQQVLDKALAIAVDYTHYVKPAAAADDKARIDEALANRRQDKPGKTLGDVPQAHVDSVRGDATAEALDALPIDELEIAVANMTPAQLEKFLRSAPGASANGRGNED